MIRKSDGDFPLGWLDPERDQLGQWELVGCALHIVGRFPDGDNP